MHRSLAVTLSLAAVAVASLTLSVRADDSEPITSCIAAEAKAGRALANCIGRIADPCSETPDGQSTVGEVACAQKETQVWDRLLNDEYARLLRLLKPEAAEDARKAQRIWITLRDADCRVPYYFFEGGSMVQIVGARCLLDHTAGRAILIRAWREMAEPQ